jgi:hypothetical protein
LPSGNYEVEFKPVAGYFSPASSVIPVVAGALTWVTNQYALSGTPQWGSLSVVIEPPGVGGQWRLQGDTNWLDSGFVLANLVVGSHIVEFKSVLNRITPAPRVVWVGADQQNSIAVTYLVANVSGATLPSLLQFSDATTPIAGQPPYAWTGQLWSESGYGSGTAVRRRVVLTAAHVVFNDATLSYVPDVRWFFQRYKGEFEPPVQTPRGWYVFSGYAAARTNDNSPGVSSPLSQNLDVAALYFPGDAGRGGQSGYLVSDPGETEWLQASALKTLFGYPTETVSEENRGKLHATLPGVLPFTLVTNRVFSTAGIRGYPGMSGGPVCVRSTNSVYYPAAVYLGGSEQTIVRVIDSAVADLINRADLTANTGDNNTGGGVAQWQPGFNPGDWVPGLFRVNLAPADAVVNGAGWRLAGGSSTNWIQSTNLFYPLQPGSFYIEFRPLPGYSTPPARQVTVVANQTTTIEATYSASALRLADPQVLVDGYLAMTLQGVTNRVYSIVVSTNLLNQMSAWSEVLRLTNTAAETRFTNMPPSSTPLYYRAKEL